MKKTIIRLLLIMLLLMLFLPVYAQQGGGLTADNSLGTLVNKVEQTFDITGGTNVGNNLFHSFSEFNVETGETANFIDNQSSANIISRVTGGNNSWINGELKTGNTNADLYLLNPNGIMFGSDASLDIKGFFYIAVQII